MVYASKPQINAILPSTVPAGDAQLTVTYNGVQSQTVNVWIAPAAPGVFFQQQSGTPMAVAQNYVSATEYPLNTAATPAKPGQILVLWGTGLGAIAAADNVAPGAAASDMSALPVQILVGGVAAQRLYAGRQPQTASVDNVYLTVPPGTGFGCRVPVQVVAGGVPANTTYLAITADGSPCQ